MNGAIIEIKKMLFDDYQVQVWDKNENSLLDREYFCRGYASAFITAIDIRTLPTFGNLPIYYRSGNKTELINEKSGPFSENLS